MTSVLVPKRTGGVSLDDATRQFDLLFDEYFEIAQPVRLYGMAIKTADFGENVLESGDGTEEVDEVYTDSATETDQKEIIRQLASELAQIGDRYSSQFGNDLAKADVVTVLSSLFTQAKGLEYQTFQGTMENLMTGHDRNVAEFAFIMCVSKKVAGQVGNVALKACSFFRRYIGNNYAAAVAEAGGMQQFMNQPSDR